MMKINTNSTHKFNDYVFVFWVAVFFAGIFSSAYANSPIQSQDPIVIGSVKAEYDVARSVLKLEGLLKIPKPWHVNSDSLEQDYLIATKFKLQDTAQGHMVKKKYPKAIKRNLFGENMSLFEGDVDFKNYFYLKSGVKFPLRVTLQYQSCSDNICMPPKFIEVVVEKKTDGSFGTRF